MTTFNLLTGSHGPQTLATSETGFLGSGAFIDGLSATGNGIDMRIYGTIYRGTQGTTISGSNNSLFIGQSGVVDGASGIVLSSSAIEIVQLGAGTSRVSNAGEVTGDLAGLYAYAFNDQSLVRVTNSGSIRGEEAGLLAIGPGNVIIRNSGVIEGFDYGVTTQTAFIIGNANISLTNYGTITGSMYGVFLAAGSDTVVNRGLIDGWVSTGEGSDTLDNRGGKIFGPVSMAGGSDSFDNRGGDVFEFAIDLGADDDIFRPGAGEEFVQGGAGARDQVNLSHGAGGVIDLKGSAGTGLAAGDSYAGFEHVIGSRSGADTIQGNSADNLLAGIGGNDVLFGDAGSDVLTGGLGQDTLTGGRGNDSFTYEAIDDFGDVILDFSASAAGNNDRFVFVAAELGGGLLAGTLNATRLQTRADNRAQDADDRFIFRTTDKTLWFDANGNAAGGPIMVADLQATASLRAVDIVLV